MVGRSLCPPNNHIYLLHADWRGSERNNVSRPIQSVCQRNAYDFRHVELVLYTDDTIIIATPPQPALLVSCLEIYQRPRVVTEGMEDHLCLEKDRDALR